MTASRLRALDAEMTPGPWRVMAANAFEVGDGLPLWSHTTDGAPLYARSHPDARGICYLRNHAAALAEVVEAARETEAAYAAFLTALRDFDEAEAGVCHDRALARLRAALARLEDP